MKEIRVYNDLINTLEAEARIGYEEVRVQTDLITILKAEAK